MSHSIPRKVVKVVDHRDQQIERMYGRHVGPTRNLHHRQLLSRGGGDWPSNLITLSGSGTTGTHGWVHANPGAATRLGFMVPSWIADPAEVPIYLAELVAGHAWHLLTDGLETIPLTDTDAEARMIALGIWEQPE